jgi:putative transposase
MLVKRRLVVRLYPTARQERALLHMLEVTRRLWNLLLAQRKEAWRHRRVSIGKKRQYRELTELRAAEPWFASVYRECEDAVLHRLDLAYRAFFKGGGHPRFKAAQRWEQLEFPHGAQALKWTCNQDRVKVPGVGVVRVRKGRERQIPEHGRAMVFRRCERWYALFECSTAPAPLPATGRSIGLDRGVRVLGATSEGESIANPRHGAVAANAIARAQRTLERRNVRDGNGRVLNRGGRNRGKALLLLRRAWERLRRVRRAHLHAVARDLVERYDAIAFERLAVRAMTRSAKGTREMPGRNVRAKSGLNRALLDASFSMLRTLVGEKAEGAARRVIDVAAAYSSQTCSACGNVAAEARRGERYSCVIPGCGYVGDADINASRVIAQRAFGRPAASGAGMPDRNDPRSELAPGDTRPAPHQAA